MDNFVTFSLDERYKNKARVVGIEYDGISRAYMLDEILKAPGGLVQDTINHANVRLQYDATSDRLEVLKAPAWCTPSGSHGPSSTPTRTIYAFE